MSFVNQYRSTTIYGELKVQKYNTGNINGLLDISGNTILRGDCTINGNLLATDGTLDISGNLNVTGDISGNLIGTSTNSTNSTIATDNTNASFYPTFVSATTGNLPLKVDTGISYNPNTETLSVTNINGTITNNSSTSTIATDATNASFFPTFVSATSGNLALKVDSGLIYNPSTNVLHTAVSKIDVADGAGVNEDFVIPFLGIDVGQSSVLSSAFIKYNPNTETLKVTQIETGTMNGFSTQVLANYNTDNSNNPILFFKGTGFDTANSVEATPYHAPGITYNPNTQTLNVTNINGTSTNSTNSTIATDATNASFYPTFVSATTGNLPLKVDAGISYNPSSNLLTTTVTSVNITSTATDAAYRIPFALTGTGSAALGSDSNINFNPSSNTFSVDVVKAISLNAPLSGVWFINGSNTTNLNSIVPLFKSENNFNDINSGLTSQSVAGSQVGALTSPFNLDNTCDRVIIMPDWGVIAYRDPNSGGPERINFHNANSVPCVVSPDVDDSISSCKIYYKKVEQTS